MDPRLRDHRPTEEVLTRAASEGVDLERLKREAPIEYMIRNAGAVVTAAPELADLAAGMVMAAFPEREAFRAETESGERILVFPPLAADELRRFDVLLAPLVDRPEWKRRFAYFREVNDRRGTVRELALPLDPDRYAGSEAVIGPFAAKADAELWGQQSVRPPLAFDAFPMQDRWFCDVFRGDSA